MRSPPPMLFLALVAWCGFGLVGCQTPQRDRGAPAKATPPPNEFRGAWVYDPRRFEPDEVIRDLKNAGFNAVFVRLSSAGAAYYPSQVLPKARGTTRNYASEYAEAGKKHGVQVHAWHVCFMMHNAPAESVSTAIKKGEVMRDAKGRALRPTYKVPVRTPALASNRLLELRAMVELVAAYPLDGVQFDYIRYFSPQVDFSPASRTAFEKEIGTRVKKWPSDVVSGRLRKRYHSWKTEMVSSVVRDVSQAIRAANPAAKISAAVWHDPDVGMRDYGQDWVGWVHEGYLDFVVPMNYTTRPRLLRAWIDDQRSLVNGRIPLYAGIGSYMLNRPDELNQQIAICRQAGLPGFVLYNYDERLRQRFLTEVQN
ncbi:MAG: family 10 glycosylhydrolase [Verrucomicrobia bacterium]|nr:family 10 glycosylhydrolase [Verrucomicrobiota bacterium]